MALLEILEYPDERLRTKAQPVTKFDDELQKQIDDMFETMYKAPGIGLAATQVDIHKQLIVIDVSEEKNEPLVIINPKVVEKRGIESMEEGCLSFPGERFVRRKNAHDGNDYQHRQHRLAGLYSPQIQRGSRN